VNLSGLKGLLEKKVGANGYYWSLVFDIGIRFGGTELEAFIEWEEEVYYFCHTATSTLKIHLHREKPVLAMLLSLRWVSHRAQNNFHVICACCYFLACQNCPS